MTLIKLLGKKEKKMFAKIVKTIVVIHDFVKKDKNENSKLQSEKEMIDWLYRDIFTFLLEDALKEILNLEKINGLDYFIFAEIISEYKKESLDARSFIRKVSARKIKNYSLLEDLFLNVKLELDLARRFYSKEEIEEKFKNEKISLFVDELKNGLGLHDIFSYITSCFKYDDFDLLFDRKNKEDFSKKEKNEKFNIMFEGIVAIEDEKKIDTNEMLLQNEINLLDLYSKYYVAKTLNKKQEFKSYLMSLVAKEKFNNFNRERQVNNTFGFNYDEILMIMESMNELYAKIKSNYEFESTGIMFSLPFIFETVFEDKISKEKFKFGDRKKKDFVMFLDYYKRKNTQIKAFAPYVLAYYDATKEFINKHNEINFDFEELDYIDLHVEELDI